MLCEKHGEYKAEEKFFNGIMVQSICPKCLSEKLKYEEKQQQELKAKIKKEKLIARGIEPEFFNATLENYIAENQSEEKALQAAKDLRDGKIKKLLLLGANGTGKTHLASALAKILHGKIITMFEFSSLLRGGYSKKMTEIETIEKELLIYDFVVFDEFGLSKCSEMEINSFAYFVDKSHTRGKRFMLTSNLERAATNQNNAIENYLPNAVISRFTQDSRIVEVKGRDRRRRAIPSTL
jgi:DNA replication protein DnaC